MPDLRIVPTPESWYDQPEDDPEETDDEREKREYYEDQDRLDYADRDFSDWHCR